MSEHDQAATFDSSAIGSPSGLSWKFWARTILAGAVTLWVGSSTGFGPELPGLMVVLVFVGAWLGIWLLGVVIKHPIRSLIVALVAWGALSLMEAGLVPTLLGVIIVLLLRRR